MYVKPIVIFLSLTLCLNAAGPVVHVYCSELFFKHCKPHCTPQERDAFIRGTLFPDIRHIAPIARTATHAKNVTLAQVIEAKSPFTAGMLFHAYVDEQRELIAERAKIYERLSDIPHKKKALFLKMLEDELCYRLINVPSIRKALLRYDFEESCYGIFFLRRIAWHRMQRDFLKQSPLSLIEKKVSHRQSYFTFSFDLLSRTLPLFKKYLQDVSVKNYLDYFLVSFEALLVQADVPTPKKVYPLPKI